MIEKLQKEYDRIYQCGDNISEILQFQKLLLSQNTTEIIEFHYELLRADKNKKLYQHIRLSFLKRPGIEPFLLEKLDTEKDDRMKGDILHLLGRIKSASTVQVAKDFLNHDNEYHREVALYALGWTATMESLPTLNYHMINEASPLLRKTAASAHRQLAYRIPEAKMAIIESLKEGFESERNVEVIPWIIIMIETILIKRLGIREDKDDPYIWHGDLNKAMKKTEKLLSTLEFD